MAYKTVKESFWTDPKVRQLSSDEKLLFLYFFTNPCAHYSGLYYLPVTFMIEETGLPQKTLNQCLTNLESRLMIRYDKVTSTIFVIKMFKHQNSSGGNPKVIKSGIEKQLQIIHSNILINAFIEEYQYLNLGLPQGCAKVDATLNQCSSSVSVSVTDSVKEDSLGKSENPFLEIIQDLNEKTEKNYKLTPATKTLIKARLGEGFNIDDFKKVHENMAAKWKHDPKMNQYLRPSTLYQASKFDGYLNTEVSLSDRGLVSPRTEKNIHVMNNWLAKKKEEGEREEEKGAE